MNRMKPLVQFMMLLLLAWAIVGCGQPAIETEIVEADEETADTTETPPEGPGAAETVVPDDPPAVDGAAPGDTQRDPGGTHTVLLPGDVPLEMVWIPAGTFMMGRNPDEEDSRDNEDPQREVTIASGFWMGKYPVTKRQWEAVMGTTPWRDQRFVVAHPESPVVYVSWDDAKRYCQALNDHLQQTGQHEDVGDTRLPTEAEWEYAARAGTTTRFHWGEDPEYRQVNDYAWWRGNAYDIQNRYAHQVGQKLPNPYGLHDMVGNVCEWCEDDWTWDYFDAASDGSAFIFSPRDENRVVRGGTWYHHASRCRSAYRHYLYPSSANYFIGFRLVSQ